MSKQNTIEALKESNQWVCARAACANCDDLNSKGECSHEKIPINPKTGGYAKADKNTTWASYDRAYKRWQSEPERLMGIGYVLSKEDKLACVDLDDCIDKEGNLAPWARRIVDKLNSYTEYSPSWTGLHVWVFGSIAKNVPQDAPGVKIEMYDNDHYMTITGNHFAGTPDTIENRQDELRLLWYDTNEAREQAKAAAKEAQKGQAKEQKATDTPPIHGSEKDTRYGLKALENMCQEMRDAASRTSWTTMQKLSFKVGQLVGGGELTRETALDAFSDAVMDRRNSERDIDATVTPGIDEGMKSPRSAPPRKPATDKDINLCSFDADDSGNGDAMHALYGTQLLWCGKIGWFYYTGTHWQVDSEGAMAKRLAVETLRKRRHAAVDMNVESVVKCSKADEKKVNGCVSRFKTLVNVNLDDFDSSPDMLNCKNGVVDLRTGAIEPHCYLQRFTYCSPINFDLDVSLLPEFKEYLTDVVGGGQEVIDYLQMCLGYSLTGHTSEECLFYLYGRTRSGKGTLTEIFLKILPAPLSAEKDFNTFTAKREGDNSNFDLAGLKPARMVFASESNEYQSLNPAKIKALTGGNMVDCCFKHKDHFQYKPQYKVWMSSNMPVNANPDDSALWLTRVKVIEFPNSYAGREDKTKKARLKKPDALQSILAWAVQGAIKWYKLGARGLQAPSQVVETTNSHRALLDFVQQWLDECCEVTTDDTVVSNEQVMASYEAWCKDNGVPAKRQKGLAQSLKSKDYQVGVLKRVGNKVVRGVVGFKIKTAETANLWQQQPPQQAETPVEDVPAAADTEPEVVDETPAPDEEVEMVKAEISNALQQLQKLIGKVVKTPAGEGTVDNVGDNYVEVDRYGRMHKFTGDDILTLQPCSKYEKSGVYEQR